MDRLICKNVMEYVPDIDATLAEFRRVVKPGGIAHIIDSDWGMLVVEPLGHEPSWMNCSKPQSWPITRHMPAAYCIAA